MKKHADFLIRQVGQRFVVVPVGEAADRFSGMITINDTGKFLWDLLETEQTEESLAKALTEEYDVDFDTALRDVKVFLEPIVKVGAITE